MKGKRYGIATSVIIIAISSIMYLIIQFQNYIEGIVVVIPKDAIGDFTVVFGCQGSTKDLEIKDNLGIIFMDRGTESIEMSNSIDLDIGIILLEMDYDELNDLQVGKNGTDIKSKVTDYSFNSVSPDGEIECGTTVLTFSLK